MGGVDSPRKGLTTHIFFLGGGGWENGKYLDGKQCVSTGTHEALFIKIWTQDAGFVYLSVFNSENHHDSNIPLSSNAGFS